MYVIQPKDSGVEWMNSPFQPKYSLVWKMEFKQLRSNCSELMLVISDNSENVSP